MRELKFRAWNKWEKRMMQPHEGDFIKWHAMSNWKDCLIVMQYTGLKDKNGKDMYEHDLLKGLDDNTIFEVFWNQSGGYCLKFFKNDDSILYYSVNFVENHMYKFNEKLELVGNRFENTELLHKYDKQISPNIT